MRARQQRPPRPLAGFPPRLVAVLTLAIMLVACTNHNAPLIPPLTPPVVFHGYINGSYYELEGNWPDYPNTCELWGDTIRAFMYSDNYSPSSTPSGVHVRLDIFPFIRDSLDTLPITLLVTRWSMLHVVLFTDGGVTGSYLVTPADSVYQDRGVNAEIGALERSHGGRLLLTDFAAQGSAISGTAALGPLNIEHATIDGNVQ